MLYPTVGKLVGYLICADLVYAGVLDLPTPEVVGDIVADIGKGGRAGLVRLKLIRGNATKRDVSLAFQSLHRYIEGHFREEGMRKSKNMFMGAVGDPKDGRRGGILSDGLDRGRLRRFTSFPRAILYVHVQNVWSGQWYASGLGGYK